MIAFLRELFKSKKYSSAEITSAIYLLQSNCDHNLETFYGIDFSLLNECPSYFWIDATWFVLAG